MSDLAQRLNLRKAGRDLIGDCPACGYTDGLTVSQKDGKQLYFCHACRDADAVFQAVRAAGGDDWQPAERQEPERKTSASDYAVKLWREAKPASNDDVGRYLQSRKITLPVPPTLCYHAGLKHAETGQCFPAMIGAVTCWPLNSVVAVHRTWLRLDLAAKAPISKAKMSLGPLAGGAVRLAPAGEQLAVSEGIESGLSFMQLSGIPTWAALSTGGIEALILPDVARDIIIAADHDPPGLESAGRAAECWTREGRTVRIVHPPQPGTDWNDYLKIQNEGAAA